MTKRELSMEWQDYDNTLSVVTDQDQDEEVHLSMQELIQIFEFALDNNVFRTKWENRWLDELQTSSKDKPKG